MRVGSGGGHRVLRGNAPALVTLLAVSLAVFALHGLASHEDAHGGVSTTVLASVSAPPALPNDQPTGPVDHHGGGHSESQPTSPRPDHHPGGTAAEACVALLCLLVALLGLVVLRETRGHALVLRRQRGRAALPRGRPGVPPCLHRLSVMRC